MRTKKKGYPIPIPSVTYILLMVCTSAKMRSKRILIWVKTRKKDPREKRCFTVICVITLLCVRL